MKIINRNLKNIDFECSHFQNSKSFIDHLFLQKQNNQFYFIVDDNTENKKVLSTFGIQGNIIKFPPSGSFSYFEINEKKDQDNNIIIKYLDLVKSYSKNKKINEIHFTSVPSYLNKQFSLQNNALFSNDFILSNSEIGFFYDTKLIDRNFIFNNTKSKFLRRLKRQDWYFSIENKKFLNNIYQCIKESRELSNYPITMSFKDLEMLSNRCSENIFLFSVRDSNSEIQAGCVTIKLSEELLYVFYWGELNKSRSKSPILLLVDGLIDFCQKNKIKFLDLGISTFKSNPNKGLMQFKREIGASMYSKNQYIYFFN